MSIEKTSANSLSNGIQYVFDTLYHAGNSAEAIHSAIALVASHFSFERGYIFETDPDGKTTSNTFEWCADGVTSEIGNLQHVPIEAATTANSSFYETGIFVLKSLDDLLPWEREVLEPQGIKSMFQFGIFDKGRLLGFLGFDNCRSKALLNEAEINEIAAISNILSTFFVKQRTDEEFVKNTQSQIEIMNHLNNYVYVVRPDSFEIIFMNNQARKRMNNAPYTTPCYNYFKHKNSQCEDCPIRKLSADNSHHTTREAYNSTLDLWVETSASRLHWTDGTPVYLLECADVTKQKNEHLKHIRQLETLAFVDELTGFRTFCKFKADAQEILKRHSDEFHVLVKLDIENFKLINQIYGYQTGDEILCHLASAIKRTERNKDEIFARIANDEFVALFSINDVSTAELYDDFIKNFYDIIGRDFAFKFNFAYGIYIITPEDAQEQDIKDIYEKVNVAHKEAKHDKTHKMIKYDDAMIEKALRTKEIENKMAKALQDDEFEVYLQPKYCLDSEMICGAEALTRWNNKNHDLFMPAAFIPVFERNGFITKLDFHSLHNTCKIIKDWIDRGIKPVTVSVNFSRLHLTNSAFVRELCKTVDDVGIDRHLIEIEITETAIFDNIIALRGILQELHECGFSMSMDDFGSGYSSLGLLKDLPVDTIKMDGSFFANQEDANRSKIVVGSVITMAEALGIGIVAEGVEEQQHIDLLRELNCDMVQGYYYAKPMPHKAFTELIRSPQKFKH